MVKADEESGGEIMANYNYRGQKLCTSFLITYQFARDETTCATWSSTYLGIFFAEAAGMLRSQM